MPAVRYEGEVYALHEGETVLAGLERHGIPVASSCRSGVCQSCLLRAAEGAPPAAAQKGLRDAWRAQGLFLACVCVPGEDLTVVRPGEAGRPLRTHIERIERVDERIARLWIAPPSDFEYRPGQFVNLVRTGGVIRSYSLASVPELGEPLELHIARMPGGRVSGWVHDEARAGDAIDVSGPMGACFYTPGRPDQPLLLLGTGTGLAPLYGIARDALRHGHTGPIHLFHGSPVERGLYLHEQLEGMAAASGNFHYHPCVLEGAMRHGVAQGDIGAIALERCGKLDGWRVFLCGNPELVRKMQRACFLAGAGLGMIAADAFLPAAAG